MSKDLDYINSYGRPPILFYRNFVTKTGSITAALMLSAAITKGSDWWPMSHEEWFEECGFSRTELETARKKLVAIGVLEYARRGLPGRLFYRVNVKRIADWLQAETLGGARP